MKHQKPLAIWFTGLSGSGKSTLANALEKYLAYKKMHTMLLDGDNIRHGLNRDLGFKEEDRVENIRRISEVIKLMNDAGIITISAFISPYSADRAQARQVIGDGFIEIYVKTPLEICEQRDVKNLYKRARNNQIPNFTGINSPYKEPLNAEIVVDTMDKSVDESLEEILNGLRKFMKI